MSSTERIVVLLGQVVVRSAELPSKASSVQIFSQNRMVQSGANSAPRNLISLYIFAMTTRHLVTIDDACPTSSDHSYTLNLAPPVLNTLTDVTATTLSLSWTQPGSAVDSYTVSYTYTIKQCGSGPISDSVKINDGNNRSGMLDSIEEDSDYSITLTANTGTIRLDSDVVKAITSTAGIQFLLVIHYYILEI